MPEIPSRIVSLVPSHTETLFDLGVFSKVVGRTKFCIEPKELVDAIPIVGGTKDAKLEKILELKPDLVLADRDENPKALVEALEAKGIKVLWSEIDSLVDCERFLENLGRKLHTPGASRGYANKIRAELVKPHGRSLPVFCPIWHAPWMTFDHTAYANNILEYAGFHNVFHEPHAKKYFECTAEEIKESGAELILLPTEPFPFHKMESKVKWEELGELGQRRLVISGEDLTWFGTRSSAALKRLRKIRASLPA